MARFWTYVYDLVLIPVFAGGVRVAALFQSKVRRGLRGRKRLFEELEERLRLVKPGKRLWFHSASMGEFEQAKPIIAALKKKHPDVRIIVSFFSPSGYDNSRSYRLADVVTYIPFDTKKNAVAFIDLIKPDAAVMVRYDVWPNHIWELYKREIPVFLANATMRQSSPRLKWPWRSFHSLLYGRMKAILTVSESDAENFRLFNIHLPEIAAAGETRYDQVLQRSADALTKHVLQKKFFKNRRVIVAGSTWSEDEEVLLPAFRKLHHYDASALLILVPHEPTIQALEEIEQRINFKPRSIRFSELNDYAGEPVIIVDSIGILMALYQYADIAFVGGSFRQNVHNVLEPAVYGIPVVYGPKHRNSQEAVTLAECGGGCIVQDQQEMYRTLRSLLRDRHIRTQAGESSAALVREHAGATKRFLQYLEPTLWPARTKAKRTQGRQLRKNRNR
jgi:3-deoxy-D-manno-octulosonic-acid transferase